MNCVTLHFTCIQLVLKLGTHLLRQTFCVLYFSVENRSTFKCPYCREMNLDTSAMLEHVNNNHKHENIPVVRLWTVRI